LKLSPEQPLGDFLKREAYALKNEKMSESTSGRDYDLVLIGATGYTGALTAEHIARHLPTNLRWAIAGRSSTKLNGLAARLRQLEPDRLQPGKILPFNS
jgi:hypothetical protein